ncbi:MAG: hypothetical protein AAGF93_22920 [Cyanobacteria bacterium P01_H01_bin.105]
MKSFNPWLDGDSQSGLDFWLGDIFSAPVLLGPNTWHHQQVVTTPTDGWPTDSQTIHGMGVIIPPSAICNASLVGGWG